MFTTWIKFDQFNSIQIELNWFYLDFNFLKIDSDWFEFEFVQISTNSIQIELNRFYFGFNFSKIDSGWFEFEFVQKSWRNNWTEPTGYIHNTILLKMILKISV